MKSINKRRLKFLQDVYNKDGIVTINNFLDENVADNIEQSIQTIPEHDWLVSIHPYRSDMYLFYNNQMNTGAINEGRQKAEEALNKNEFSYFFYRHDGSPLLDHVKSEEVYNCITNITGTTVTQPVDVFISKYSPGCFLHTHTDTGRGKIAFVLNLTKDWDEEDGGTFQLVGWDYSTVIKTIVPKYNSLTIFNVEGDGIPHRVTKVRESSKNHRCAISGWFT